MNVTRNQLLEVIEPGLINREEHDGKFNPITRHNDGTFTLRYTFFYRHSKDAQWWSQCVIDYFDDRNIEIEVIDKGEEYNSWPDDSFWYVTFRIIGDTYRNDPTYTHVVSWSTERERIVVQWVLDYWFDILNDPAWLRDNNHVNKDGYAVSRLIRCLYLDDDWYACLLDELERYKDMIVTESNLSGKQLTSLKRTTSRSINGILNRHETLPDGDLSVFSIDFEAEVEDSLELQPVANFVARSRVTEILQGLDGDTLPYQYVVTEWGNVDEMDVPEVIRQCRGDEWLVDNSTD